MQLGRKSGGLQRYISAPKIWNSLLPSHILQSQTLSSFRRHLKTHYFQSAYSAHPQYALILF